MNEIDYINGKKQAYTNMLILCLREIGMDGSQESWVVERTETILALRGLCDVHGDNDWEDDLYIPDIINKHVY